LTEGHPSVPLRRDFAAMARDPTIADISEAPRRRALP
jgi:hypothetical protein